MLFSVLVLSCSTPQETAKREEQQGTLSIPQQFIGSWKDLKNTTLYLNVFENKVVFNQKDEQVVQLLSGTPGAQYYWEYTLFLPNNGTYTMNLYDTNTMFMNYSENGVWRGVITFRKQ